MPPRSKIERLPPEMRSFITSWLERHAFSDYDGLTQAFHAEFEDRLAELGLTISRASFHRFGEQFEERVSALKRSTEMAQAMREALPDDEGALNEAVIRLTQTKVFNLLMDLELSPDDVDLAKLTRAVHELSRSDIQLKKYRAETAARAKEAAESVEKTVRSEGLSKAAADQIRKQILGIAS